MQDSVIGIYAFGISKHFLRDHDEYHALFNPHTLKRDGNEITPVIFSSNLDAISEPLGVIGRAFVTFPKYDRRRRWRRRGSGWAFSPNIFGKNIFLTRVINFSGKKY